MLGIDTTFSEYSRFVTKFDNANYDTKLPAANKIFAPSQTATNLREGEERKLVRPSLQSLRTQL
jgi:hypothetical protein